jgi:ATP-binding cassette subfamily C protein
MLGKALWHWCRDVMVGPAVISGVMNFLAMTGSFYMLHMHDLALASRSLPTLVGLTLLMLVLYALYGLDAVRSQVIARLGGRIDWQLRSSVLSAILRSPPTRSSAR